MTLGGTMGRDSLGLFSFTLRHCFVERRLRLFDTLGS